MIKKILPKSEFAKNVLTLMTGTSIAQLLPVLVSPILTALYSPHDMGVFTLYFSISTIFSLLATARYEMAIVLPNDERESINLVGLSLFFSVLISVLGLLLICFFGNWTAEFFKEDELKIFLWFLPLTILSTGIFQTFYYYSLRHKKFSAITYSKIIQNVTLVVLSIILGLYKSQSGMITGLIVGQIIGCFFMVYFVLRENKKLWNELSHLEMRKQAKIHKDFPRINIFHVLIDSVQFNGASFLISYFYGNAILGWYGLSLRALRAPSGVIGSALSQVLYPRLAQAYNNGENIKPLVKKSMIQLAIIVLPLTIILLFFAPALFAFVFGERWRMAGVYTQILLPYMFFNFIVSPVSQLPFVLGKQKMFFIISSVGNICSFASLFIAGYMLFNEKIALGIYGAISAMLMVVVSFWIYKIAETQKQISNEQ